MENASEAVSAPCRLRSTSAWLRSCTVATSATSNAIVQTATAPAAGRLRGGLLERAGMRCHQACVVGGQGQIRTAGHLDADVELDLPHPQAWQGRGVLER